MKPRGVTPDDRVQVPFRLDQELVDRIDVERGDVPRQRWLERLVRQALGMELPRVAPAGSVMDRDAA